MDPETYLWLHQVENRRRTRELVRRAEHADRQPATPDLVVTTRRTLPRLVALRTWHRSRTMPS